MATQEQERQRQNSHFSRKRLIVLIFAALLIVVATGIIILRITGNAQVGWSTILSLILTVFGVILALLQWLLPLPSEVTAIPHKSVPNNTKLHVQVGGIDLGVSKKKGALVVYAREELRGKTVDLQAGFATPITIAFYERFARKKRAAANIVKRKINARIEFAAIFPGLTPRDYSIYIYDGSIRQSASVTVYPGQVTEVDWR